MHAGARGRNVGERGWYAARMLPTPDEVRREARHAAGVVLLLLALVSAFAAGRSCGLGTAEDREFAPRWR